MSWSVAEVTGVIGGRGRSKDDTTIITTTTTVATATKETQRKMSVTPCRPTFSKATRHHFLATESFELHFHTRLLLLK